MAELLLQVAHDRAGPLSRARPFHPVHEAEEHAALDDGRGFDYALGAGILRLAENRTPVLTRLLLRNNLRLFQDIINSRFVGRGQNANLHHRRYVYFGYWRCDRRPDCFFQRPSGRHGIGEGSGGRGFRKGWRAGSRRGTGPRLVWIWLGYEPEANRSSQAG